MLGIAEMIRCGTTAYADMYDHMDQEARAVEESGIRACLCRGSIGIGPNAQAGLDENRQLFLDWHGKADGRITVMMGPHAPYTCPPDYLHKSSTRHGNWAPKSISTSAKQKEKWKTSSSNTASRPLP